MQVKIKIKRLTAGAIYCSLSLVGCAMPYNGPTQGPVAHVKFTDNIGDTALGGRRTAVLFFDDEKCTKATSVGSKDFIAIPANRTVTFFQYWESGSSMVQGRCGIWGQLDLTEGQRAEVKFSFSAYDARIRCSINAQDQTPGGNYGNLIPIGKPTAPACKY